MVSRTTSAVLLIATAIAINTGCASKKYVRTQIAERVQPLENRTGELEETSRRNTQQISDIDAEIYDVRGKADQALKTSGRAAQSAERANTRVGQVEGSISSLRENIDHYTVRNVSMVFFRPRSAVLTHEAMAQLNALAVQVANHQGFLLEIIGFGDGSPTGRKSADLAALRAQAVERYLADKQDVPVMRMYAIGFGELGSMNAATAPVSGAIVGAADSAAHNRAEVLRSVRIRVLTNDAVASDRQRQRTASEESINRR